MRIGDWNRLRTEVWGLKTEHIADVFGSLQIAEITPDSVFPGPIGEAAGICFRLCEGESQRRDALAYVLALAVVLSDGDIFLNCLAAEFETDVVAEKLSRMLRVKREQLFDVVSDAHEREAIASAIAIERQKTNKGGASKGGLSSRLTNIREATKRLGLAQPRDPFHVEPMSADYLRHVIPSRKEWARSFGLLDKDGTLTDGGWRFLSVFAQDGYATASGEYSLLPTRFELRKARLDVIEPLLAKAPTTWQYAATVWRALGGLGPFELIPGQASQEPAETLKQIFATYRELSQDRRMLRNEIPILAVYAAYLGIARAASRSPVDLEAWLASSAPESYGVKQRTSRTIESGLIVS
jgi:hypothetical protein